MIKQKVYWREIEHIDPEGRSVRMPLFGIFVQ